MKPNELAVRLGAKTVAEQSAMSRQIRRLAKAGRISGARKTKGGHHYFPETQKFDIWIKEHKDGKLQLTVADPPPVPKRTVKHVANTIRPIYQFFNDFTKFRQQLEKINVNDPMKAWDSNTLSKFISDADWFLTEVQTARDLYAAKRPKQP